MSKNYLLKAVPDENFIEITLKNDNFLKVHFLDAKEINLNCGKDVIGYREIWEDTDLIFDIEDQKIKETIMLKTNKSPNEFRFKIETNLKPDFTRDQIVFTDDKKNIVYFIENPFIILKNNHIIKNPPSIKHSFDEENNIYSIFVREFAESEYPIMIDPTVVFPTEGSNSPESKGFGARTVANIYLTGSNENGENLGFSNVVNYDDSKPETDPTRVYSNPIINGSDKVTFNQNILVRMDFLFGTDKKPQIKSVNITDGRKITTIFNKSTVDFKFNASLSPVLLYVPWNSNDVIARQSEYTFVLKFSENIKQFKDYQITADLVSSPNDIGYNTSNLTYGQILIPTKEQDGITYKIKYEPPSSKTNGMNDNVLLRVKIDLKYEVGNNIKSFSKIYYSYIQFVEEMNENSIDKFQFKSNSSKKDSINGDFYAPTENRGLVVIDTSLGLTRVIDQHYGLKSEQDLNVFCAGRIGDIEKHTPETYSDSTIFDRLYKGLLVCTLGGVYYFESHPFSEPAEYKNPYKISNKVIIDFTMSGPYLFMLDSDGEIYRIGYKHLLNQIYRVMRTTNENTAMDLAITIDLILDDLEHKPFDKEHFKDVNEDGTVDARYQTVYQPSSDGLPEKLLPFSIGSSVGNSSQSNPFSNAYETGTYLNWHGITILFKDSVLDKKIACSIAYPPVGKYKDAYDVYETLYNYLDEKDSDIIDSFPDNESQLNKALFVSYVDVSPNGNYQITKVATEDKPLITFKFNYLDSDSEQYNEVCVLNAGPVYNSGSRVIVGTLMPFNEDNSELLLKSQPEEDSLYLCPQNVSIQDVEETGPYYNPLTGEEIET